MNQSVLKSLLIEYDKKRLLAEEKARTFQEDLYKSIPEIVQIEDQISKLAIGTTKQLIQNQNIDLLTNLKAKIETLRTEKKNLLLSRSISEKDLLPHYECQKCGDTRLCFSKWHFYYV